MFYVDPKKLRLPRRDEALPGRAEAMRVPEVHFVNGNRLVPPFPDGVEQAMFGMGCFWGAERKFWRVGEGVYSTAVGYAGGYTQNPTYREVCSGRTGHNEVVRVIFFPKLVSYESLLRVFWESHDPTQGMRQGNDVGTARGCTATRRRSGRPPRRRATPTSARSRRRATARSRPSCSTRRPSTTQRTTTSSTS